MLDRHAQETWVPHDDANPWDDPAAASTDEPAPAPAPAAATPPPAPAAPGDAPDDGTAAEPGTEPDEAAAPVRSDAAVEEPPPEDRRRVLLIAGVAFVVIAALAFALTRGGDDDTTGPAGTQPAGGSGGEQAGGTVTVSGTTDSFDRPDTTDGLGALPSGAPWVVQSGGWAVQGGAAVVVAPEAEKRNTVYVASGYPDPQAQVRLPVIANNAGLVFRYQGECNYWSVTAVPEFATWNVEKVVDCARVPGEGDSQVFRTITQAPVADGTTVGVVLEGEQVRIAINGRVVLTFDDPDLAGVGRVGLTTRGPAEVRFDDFVAGGPEGQGVVGGTTVPGEGATTAPAEGPTTAPEGDAATTSAPEGGDGG